MSGRIAYARDEGFSLSELMVVIALLGLVLGAAWSLLRITTISVDQNNEVSWMSRDISKPLEHVERMFSQLAPPIQDAGPYHCTIRTDMDRDNLYEYRAFEATTDGRLVERYYEEIADPFATYTPEVRLWSDGNANRAHGTPVFTYYDLTGAVISNTNVTLIKQEAGSVVVTIVSERGGREYTDSREVFFRNR